MKTVGVAIADRGSGIVTVERSEDESLFVTDIERLPFDVSVVADRVKDLDGPDIRFVIDADGLGGALWTVMGGPDNQQHWQLYSGKGLERQALVDELMVAIGKHRFRFAAGLAEQDSMSKAMLGYRRKVQEDGVIGSELVLALLMAIRPLPTEAWFMYG